jgi:acyl dehydratase
MAYQPIFTEHHHQSEPSRTLSEDDFAVPVEDRYFEDYKTGSLYEYGYYEVDEAEVVDFAKRFDPQAFHTDPEAAHQAWTRCAGVLLSVPAIA